MPAWATATTYVSGQASSSGLPVGSPIYDSATLGWGVNPTGTITFRLYHPTDPNCVAAHRSSPPNTAVSGNGYYESARYVSTMAGNYRWTATYNGDANNSPSSTPCGDSTAMVSVAKRTPTLSGSAAASSRTGRRRPIPPPSTGATPTGTMWYRVYGPNNMTCAGGPIHTSSRSVAGNGNYTSPAFTAPATGTYRWTVNYSGDSNNMAAGTTCTDPANAVDLIAGAEPSAPPRRRRSHGAASLTVDLERDPAPTSTDWVGLYAVGGADSEVAAWRYTTGTAGGSVTFTVPSGTFPAPTRSACSPTTAMCDWRPPGSSPSPSDGRVTGDGSGPGAHLHGADAQAHHEQASQPVQQVEPGPSSGCGTSR